MDRGQYPVAGLLACREIIDGIWPGGDHQPPRQAFATGPKPRCLNQDREAALSRWRRRRESRKAAAAPRMGKGAGTDGDEVVKRKEEELA